MRPYKTFGHRHLRAIIGKRMFADAVPAGLAFHGTSTANTSFSGQDDRRRRRRLSLQPRGSSIGTQVIAVRKSVNLRAERGRGSRHDDGQSRLLRFVPRTTPSPITAHACVVHTGAQPTTCQRSRADVEALTGVPGAVGGGQ